MWILTNGANVGVTSLIGEAVRNEISEFKFSRTKSDTRKGINISAIGITRQDLLRNGDNIGNTKAVSI